MHSNTRACLQCCKHFARHIDSSKQQAPWWYVNETAPMQRWICLCVCMLAPSRHPMLAAGMCAIMPIMPRVVSRCSAHVTWTCLVILQARRLGRLARWAVALCRCTHDPLTFLCSDALWCQAMLLNVCGSFHRALDTLCVLGCMSFPCASCGFCMRVLSTHACRTGTRSAVALGL